jgi:hypothetical protein
VDPTANLAEQRRIQARIADSDGDVDTDDLLRLAELAEALDQWCEGGGFRPAQWSRNLSRG